MPQGAFKGQWLPIWAWVVPSHQGYINGEARHLPFHIKVLSGKALRPEGSGAGSLYDLLFVCHWAVLCTCPVHIFETLLLSNWNGLLFDTDRTHIGRPLTVTESSHPIPSVTTKHFIHPSLTLCLLLKWQRKAQGTSLQDSWTNTQAGKGPIEVSAPETSRQQLTQVQPCLSSLSRYNDLEKVKEILLPFLLFVLLSWSEWMGRMPLVSSLSGLQLFSKLVLLWQGLNVIWPYPTQTLDPEVYSSFIHYNLKEEATQHVFSLISKYDVAHL